MRRDHEPWGTTSDVGTDIDPNDLIWDRHRGFGDRNVVCCLSAGVLPRSRHDHRQLQERRHRGGVKDANLVISRRVFSRQLHADGKT